MFGNAPLDPMSTPPPNRAVKGKGQKKKGKQVASGTQDHPGFDQPIPADVDKSPEELMRLAFKRAMISGNFLDTTFYAYSRRKTSGVIYSPKAVHANSYILRAKEPQYFEPLLRSGFDGCSIEGQLDGGFPSDFPAEIDDPGYGSDSDLEDDEEPLPQNAEVPIAGGSLASADAREVSTSRADGCGAGKKPEESEVNGEPESHGEKLALGGTGRIHLIRTFAFPTWQSFIFYTSTGKIAFSRLKSQPKIPAIFLFQTHDAGAHPTSPKSMYKLAHRLGLKELKNLAKDDIASKMSADNILAELFSSFTAQYDEIQELEITYACNKAREVVAKGLYSWMEGIEAEDLKHSAGMLARLFQKMAGTPSSSPVRPTTCPSCRAGANGAAFYLKCSTCNYNL